MFTLHKGDCLSFMRTLPDKCVDAVVTSPPYNLVKEYSGGGPNSGMKRLEAKLENDWYPDEMPEEEYQAWQKEIISECLRICRGSIFYNHKVRYAIKRRGDIIHPLDWLREFPIWTEIIWDRDGGQGGNSGRWILSDERIYQIQRPVVWHGKAGTNVWRIRPVADGEHPCTFPAQLVKRCLKPTTNPGNTVFDPFMGSGTVGTVCINMGLNFIGCEINPEFFAVAEKRMKQAVLQQNLFTPSNTACTRLGGTLRQSSLFPTDGTSAKGDERKPAPSG